MACGVSRRTKAYTAVQNGQSWTEGRIPSWRHGTIPPIAPPNGEAVDPEAESAERVDHKVHGRSVGGVFRPAQTRLHKHKPGLHEHDQEACD
jgi:hypothetical protein